jgi:hypothetical protein
MLTLESQKTILNDDFKLVIIKKREKKNFRLCYRLLCQF